MADHGLAQNFFAFGAWFSKKICAARSALKYLYDGASGDSVKVFVIKESNKVLFAEVDRKFVLGLSRIVMLPLAIIMDVLGRHHGNKAATIGSINSLFQSLGNLDTSHFQIGLGSEAKFLEQMLEFERWDRSFLTGQVSSFIVTDDLQILTNSPESYTHVLKVNGIDDDRASLEERTLTFAWNQIDTIPLHLVLVQMIDSRFRFDQITRLLERLLVSKTPLTDVFCDGWSAGTATSDESAMVAGDSLLPEARELRPTDSCPMNVKALVQKSTRRVLLVQSREDFADFIFSFHFLPLKTIQLLFDGKACVGSVDNLYRSMMKLCGEPCVMSLDTNNTSHEPFFPLNQPGTPSFYPVNATENRDQSRFVKGPALFTVTDDLVVSTPPASTISILDQMKIAPSDVEELDINVGVKEALSILKASLTSTSALTNGLKPFLRTDPEQEEWCTF